MVLAYITAKDREEALKIGRELVAKRLAACVNVFAQMESIYRWEGKIDQSTEAVLIAKTEASRVQPLIQEVKRLHSYKVPCVLTIEVKEGNPEYLKWLKDSLEGK